MKYIPLTRTLASSESRNVEHLFFRIQSQPMVPELEAEALLNYAKSNWLILTQHLDISETKISALWERIVEGRPDLVKDCARDGPVVEHALIPVVVLLIEGIFPNLGAKEMILICAMNIFGRTPDDFDELPTVMVTTLQRQAPVLMQLLILFASHTGNEDMGPQLLPFVAPFIKGRMQFHDDVSALHLALGLRKLSQATDPLFSQAGHMLDHQRWCSFPIWSVSRHCCQRPSTSNAPNAWFYF